MHNDAQTFFENYCKKPADNFLELAQSGSARSNFVATCNHKKYIVTANSHLAENESFFYFSEIFEKLQLNTPKILAISENRTLYVQEFLGNETLSEILTKEGLTNRTKKLVERSLHQLFLLQSLASSKIDYSKTLEYEVYDELPISSDLFYFKSFIADVLEIPYQKAALLKDFKKLTAKLEDIQPKGLMLRDFQARNIMVNENDEVFFIDYQAAMRGPMMYDVISFLYQAKANFPENFKEEMVNFYLSLWKDQDISLQLKNSVKPLQLIRYLQVLGAYGFRGLVQKKSHFKQSLWQGIKNITTFHWDQMQELQELQKTINALGTTEIKQKIENLM